MGFGLFVGLSTVDIAYRVGSYPIEDSKTQASDQYIGAGGPAANAAVAYAALGGLPTLISAVGASRLSELIHSDLSAHGVNVVDVLAGSEHRPPVSSIVVSESAATRTVVSLDGSQTETRFGLHLLDHLSGADFVLVDGHYPNLAAGACMKANQLGVPVVLDAGRWKDAHSEILPFVQSAICSATYAPPGVDAGNVDAVCASLQAAGIENVAITHGAGPILGVSGDQKFDIPVPETAAVDTLGAGDILHGAYCFYASGGRSFIEALSEAARVASFSCRYFGTRQWCAYIRQVLE